LLIRASLQDGGSADGEDGRGRKDARQTRRTTINLAAAAAAAAATAAAEDAEAVVVATTMSTSGHVTYRYADISTTKLGCRTLID